MFIIAIVITVFVTLAFVTMIQQGLFNSNKGAQNVYRNLGDSYRNIYPVISGILRSKL